MFNKYGRVRIVIWEKIKGDEIEIPRKKMPGYYDDYKVALRHKEKLNRGFRKLNLPYRAAIGWEE